MTIELCGCYYFDPIWAQNVGSPVRTWLPKVDTIIQATISANAARTVLKQTFQNSSTTDIIDQLYYSFPLYDGVSIIGYDIHVQDRHIKGLVKEKGVARATYEAATWRGETASLFEQSSQAADVFTIKIGNVPPATTILVEIVYIGELKHDAEVDGIRFTIPTAIAPRYGSSAISASLPNISKSSTISITVDVSMPNGKHILKLSSPSHSVSVSPGMITTSPEDEPALSRASASLALSTAELGKDFVLLIELGKHLYTPMALLEKHPSWADQQALMITFVPRFEISPIRAEIVFVVDRSRSMRANISTLISALTVFLKSLPLGICFNICSFGNRHEFLWPKSQPYNQASLQDALASVSTFRVNLWWNGD